jgi:hypothetical protein
MEPKVISHDDWIEQGRKAVLDALDQYVRTTTQFGASRGWVDQELPNLFRAVDAHLDSIAERINLGIEPGSLFVRIEKAQE